MVRSAGGRVKPTPVGARGRVCACVVGRRVGRCSWYLGGIAVSHGTRIFRGRGGFGAAIQGNCKDQVGGVLWEGAW